MHWEEAWTHSSCLFPELSLIHLYLGSCQIKCRFCLFPLFSCCHQLGPGPHSFCSPSSQGILPASSLQVSPNHPSSVLTISETQLGSFHYLLRSCQCLPSTFWMKCNMPHPDIWDKSTFLILILIDLLQSTPSQGEIVAIFPKPGVSYSVPASYFNSAT